MIASKTPQVGDWYTFCCEEDLTQIEDDEELAGVIEAIEDGEPTYPTGVWATKEEALRDLGVMWERSGVRS